MIDLLSFLPPCSKICNAPKLSVIFQQTFKTYQRSEFTARVILISFQQLRVTAGINALREVYVLKCICCQ